MQKPSIDVARRAEFNRLLDEALDCPTAQRAQWIDALDAQCDDLKPRLRELSDHALLWMTRAVVVCFAVLVTAYSLTSTETIHKMVENAYKVTLVAAFVPLAAGIYWKRATTQGALAASIAGLVVWIGMEISAPDAAVPPQLAGLLASVLGMVSGSLAPQLYGLRQPAA